MQKCQSIGQHNMKRHLVQKAHKLKRQRTSAGATNINESFPFRWTSSTFLLFCSPQQSRPLIKCNEQHLYTARDHNHLSISLIINPMWVQRSHWVKNNSNTTIILPLPFPPSRRHWTWVQPMFWNNYLYWWIPCGEQRMSHQTKGMQNCDWW